jgi:hypothetical protein
MSRFGTCIALGCVLGGALDASAQTTGDPAVVQPAPNAVKGAGVLAMSPGEISRLKPTDIIEIDPALIPNLGTDQIEALTPELVGSFKASQLAMLTAVQLASMSQAQLQAIPVSLVGNLDRSAVKQLSDVQLSWFTPRQLTNLDEGTKEDVKARLDIRAIKPGIRLIGDAYSQLVKTAEDGANSQSSFGGGVEIEAIGNETHSTSKTIIVIRKGTKPSTLDTGEQFGDALLNPQSQAVFAGAEVEWFPACAKVGNTLFGVHGHLNAARSDWKVELAPAREADPMNVLVDARPVQSETAPVYTFNLGAMFAMRYVASGGDNYVDVEALVGPTLRWLSFDDGVTSRIAEKRAIDDRIPEKTFPQFALGGDDRVFIGADIGVALRINSIVLSATVTVVADDVSGLSGWRFTPALSLRAGPQLIAFDGAP